MGRDIPEHNFGLHAAHCERNLRRCEHCDEMVARGCEEIHYNEFHAKVSCPGCGQSLEKNNLADHDKMECPMRSVLCQYCDLDQVAADLAGHQVSCGNRTEWCGFCQNWIRLNELEEHEERMHSGAQDEPSEATYERPTSDGNNGDQDRSEVVGVNGESNQRAGRNSRGMDRNLLLMATAGAAAVVLAVVVGALGLNHRKSF